MRLVALVGLLGLRAAHSLLSPNSISLGADDSSDDSGEGMDNAGGSLLHRGGGVEAALHRGAGVEAALPRGRDLQQLSASENATEQYMVFDIYGNDQSNNPYYYLQGAGRGVLAYSRLEMTDSSNLVQNNLGGLGPNTADPPFIGIRQVTTLRGVSVGMRIFNTSAYNPSNVRINRYRQQMFQK